jgi:cholinesterase
MRALVSTALWASLLKLSLAAPRSNFEIVETANGLITGHHSPNVENVWEYLGIPYAQPPFGDLRFAAPQAYKVKEPYAATKFVSVHFISEYCEID